MIRVVYSPPPMHRAIAPLPRTVQASAAVQAASPAQRTPLVPHRLVNYAQGMRAWGPKSSSFLIPAQQVAAEQSARPTLPASTRKLCAFTGLTLKNGKFDPDQALTSIRRNAGPGLRTAMERPAGDAKRASLPRSTFGVLVAAATGAAGNEAQPAKAVVPAGAPTASQPVSRAAEGEGDRALDRIATIRLKWQSGYYAAQANATAATRTADVAVQRISTEIAQARNADG